MLRIGTCGGIGLPPGSVVVTEEALDGRLRPTLDTVQSVNSIQHIHSVPLSLSIVPYRLNQKCWRLQSPSKD